ncbi:hypothetical protein [Gordonia hydrophobica]|uniref:Uncharacterized protein n=1 Tax=Gordonia hydrophobica TaxID=40516 RepID=A0ABZ2TXJ1_9ACTN|nr:hypothetical protein [Gordonia hydrophobica]MBM7366366.1 hypothetical protein [Gordonia hydrophobica]
MTLTLYPAYDSVFATDEALGIFYPLCTLTTDDGQDFHFVSSTGLWRADESVTTEFRLEGGRYSLVDDASAFQGADGARPLFAALDADFAHHGEQYLADELRSGEYVQKLEDQVSHLASEDLDLEYFLTTFYCFAVNRLIFTSSGTFNQFRHVIEGWADPDPSPVVHEVDESMLEESLEGEDDPFDDDHRLGMIIGSEFFTDGNDEIHLFKATTSTVTVVSAYS